MKTTQTESPETTTATSDVATVLLDKACDISSFASTDAARYVLNSVHFRAGDCEATDGRMLIRVPYASAEGRTGELDALVPAVAVKDGARMAGKAGSLALEVTGKALFSSAGKALTTELVEGTYPTVDQVIPTEPAHYKICLVGRLLKTIAEYAMKNGVGGSPGITFEFGEDALSPVRFSVALGADRVAKGVLMPMRSPAA